MLPLNILRLKSQQNNSKSGYLQVKNHVESDLLILSLICEDLPFRVVGHTFFKKLLKSDNRFINFYVEFGVGLAGKKYIITCCYYWIS